MTDDAVDSTLPYADFEEIPLEPALQNKLVNALQGFASADEAYLTAISNQHLNPFKIKIPKRVSITLVGAALQGWLFGPGSKRYYCDPRFQNLLDKFTHQGQAFRDHGLEKMLVTAGTGSNTVLGAACYEDFLKIYGEFFGWVTLSDPDNYLRLSNASLKEKVSHGVDQVFRLLTAGATTLPFAFLDSEGADLSGVILAWLGSVALIPVHAEGINGLIRWGYSRRLVYAIPTTPKRALEIARNCLVDHLEAQLGALRKAGIPQIEAQSHLLRELLQNNELTQSEKLRRYLQCLFHLSTPSVSGPKQALMNYDNAPQDYLNDLVDAYRLTHPHTSLQAALYKVLKRRLLQTPGSTHRPQAWLPKWACLKSLQAYDHRVRHLTPKLSLEASLRQNLTATGQWASGLLTGPLLLTGVILYGLSLMLYRILDSLKSLVIPAFSNKKTLTQNLSALKTTLINCIDRVASLYFRLFFALSVVGYGFKVGMGFLPSSKKMPEYFGDQLKTDKYACLEDMKSGKYFEYYKAFEDYDTTDWLWYNAFSSWVNIPLIGLCLKSGDVCYEGSKDALFNTFIRGPQNVINNVLDFFDCQEYQWQVPEARGNPSLLYLLSPALWWVKVVTLFSLFTWCWATNSFSNVSTVPVLFDYLSQEQPGLKPTLDWLDWNLYWFTVVSSPGANLYYGNLVVDSFLVWLVRAYTTRFTAYQENIAKTCSDIQNNIERLPAMNTPNFRQILINDIPLNPMLNLMKAEGMTRREIYQAYGVNADEPIVTRRGTIELEEIEKPRAAGNPGKRGFFQKRGANKPAEQVPPPTISPSKRKGVYRELKGTQPTGTEKYRYRFLSDEQVRRASAQASARPRPTGLSHR